MSGRRAKWLRRDTWWAAVAYAPGSGLRRPYLQPGDPEAVLYRSWYDRDCWRLIPPSWHRMLGRMRRANRRRALGLLPPGAW